MGKKWRKGGGKRRGGAQRQSRAPTGLRRKTGGSGRPPEFVSFDFDERKNFLTGFSKRKQQRKAYAADTAMKRYKEQMSEARKKKKTDMLEALQRRYDRLIPKPQIGSVLVSVDADFESSSGSSSEDASSSDSSSSSGSGSDGSSASEGDPLPQDFVTVTVTEVPTNQDQHTTPQGEKKSKTERASVDTTGRGKYGSTQRDTVQEGKSKADTPEKASRKKYEKFHLFSESGRPEIRKVRIVTPPDAQQTSDMPMPQLVEVKKPTKKGKKRQRDADETIGDGVAWFERPRHNKKHKKGSQKSRKRWGGGRRR